MNNVHLGFLMFFNVDERREASLLGAPRRANCVNPPSRILTWPLESAATSTEAHACCCCCCHSASASSRSWGENPEDAACLAWSSTSPLLLMDWDDVAELSPVEADDDEEDVATLSAYRILEQGKVPPMWESSRGNRVQVVARIEGEESLVADDVVNKV